MKKHQSYQSSHRDITRTNHKRIKIRSKHLIPAISGTGLVLLVLSLLFPFTPNSSSALTNASDTAISRVSVHNAAMVGIALDSRIDIDATPTSTGTFAIGNATLGVTTNNPEGYKIFLSSVASNQLLGANDAIDSITSSTVGTAFTGNTWGYSLEPGTTEATEANTYHAVPTATTEIYNEPSATASEELYNYNLAFGVHITPSLEAGEYSNNIVVSVVANPNTISSLQDLVYMQDMTPEICQNTPSAYNHETGTTDKNSPYYLEPITKQLYDLRDGNKYWVAKLADGECWMTQNLALNLGERPEDAPDYYSRYVKTLTPADSDVTADWTVPVNTTTYRTDPNDPSKTETVEIYGTETEVPRKDTAPGVEQDLRVRSWNLGKIILANPTASQSCTQDIPEKLAELGYTAPTNDIYTAWTGQNPAETCSYYQDMMSSGLIPSNSTIATETSSIVDGEYDAHYLIGNFYSWSAATAGTGIEASNKNGDNNTAAETDMTKLVDATGSICPSGWQLPVGGNYFADDEGWPFDRKASAYRLWHAYGYPSNDMHSSDVALRLDYWVNSTSPYTTLVGEGRMRIDYRPIYFVRSGLIDPSLGVVQGGGFSGQILTSTQAPTRTYAAFATSINSNNAFAGQHVRKFRGESIRCLAK